MTKTNCVHFKKCSACSENLSRVNIAFKIDRKQKKTNRTCLNTFKKRNAVRKKKKKKKKILFKFFAHKKKVFFKKWEGKEFKRQRFCENKRLSKIT